MQSAEVFVLYILSHANKHFSNQGLNKLLNYTSTLRASKDHAPVLANTENDSIVESVRKTDIVSELEA
jgi:hypothetical protein